MRVVVQSYAYTMIKVSALRTLNLNYKDYLTLKRIKDPHDLLVACDQFFPGISNVKELNLIEIEKAFFAIYFKIFEKILTSSPEKMQEMLKSLLRKYEFYNIKAYLSCKLAGMSQDEIREEIYYEAERILQRTHFIENLLSKSTVQEVVSFLKTGKYAKIIERGIYYYNQNKEIFLLQALLDKEYYMELLDSLNGYPKGIEKRIFTKYIHIMLDKYNINLIARSIKNNVSYDLIKQLTIPEGSLFTINFLDSLSKTKNIHEFREKLSNYLKTDQKMKQVIANLSDEDYISPILKMLDNKVEEIIPQAGVDNLELQTIVDILTFIFEKENEIYQIIALFVKLFHNIEIDL